MSPVCRIFFWYDSGGNNTGGGSGCGIDTGCGGNGGVIISINKSLNIQLVAHVCLLPDCVGRALGLCMHQHFLHLF